jgi:two-component sensor histidine kinase
MEPIPTGNVKSRIDRALTALHRNIAPSSFQAYLFAICCVVVAALTRLVLGWISDDIAPFVTFYPATLVAALIGGLGPGVLAATLGGVIAWWALLPPQFSFYMSRKGDVVSLLTYWVGSVLIVWAGDYFRSLSKRLEDEENFRRLAVQELSHRLKNKIATIQAIMAIQLREHPQVRDDILGRLNALSATDELIGQTQGQGAHLSEIVSAELGPYALSRAIIKGPSAFLPPKVALTMALLLHELATNSAKYGSLSAENGRVSVTWSAAGPALSLEWRESNGPVVQPPTRKGFGLRLMARALDQFRGSVETNFDASGLNCKMNLIIPQSTNGQAAKAADQMRMSSQSGP